MIIQIKHAAFAGKVSAWRNTAENIEVNGNMLPKDAEGMPAMELYVDGADSIRNILKAYCTLAAHDAERFQSVHKQMVEADENMI